MKKFFPFVLMFIFLLNCSSQRAGLKETSREQQLEKLKKEVQKNPANPVGHYKLALHYSGSGQTDEALMELDEALKLDSTMIPAMIQKAELLIKNGQPRDGYSLYLKSIMTEGGRAYVSQISEKVGCPYQIHQLTTGNYHNAFPSYSPDGKLIVFQSNRDGNWEIYTRDVTTGYEQRLTKNPAQDESPVYSPNGKVIVFTSTRDDSVHQQPEEMWREIYFMNSDGGNVVRVTTTQADDWYPSFSPKGHLLLFVSEESDVREVAFHEKWSDIYLLELKNNTVIQLTKNQMDNSAPSFSPDGERIIFCSNRNGQFHIYRMNEKGEQVTQLTFHKGQDGAPHYSPEGKKITFFSNVNGNYDIYLMDEDGANLIRLTNDPARDAYPSFSPDGKKIVFHSERSGKFQIYLIDLENSTPREEVVKQLEDKIASGGK